MSKWFLIVILIFSIIISACGILPNGEDVNGMAYIKPTGYSDPDSYWSNEENAYDDDTGTFASSPSDLMPETWSSYIIFTHDAMYASKVRFYITAAGATAVDIDIYYSGAWHDLHNGAFSDNNWNDYSFGSVQSITQVRFRFYNGSEDVAVARINEVEIYAPIPTITTLDVSNVLTTTVKGNGNITDKGDADVTTRGFKYGLTKAPTWDVHEDGTYGNGEYTKDISSLTPNTTYWIRAYAVNTEGTGYGDWVQFQTAAEGVIPTGTKLNICSDYSGYTYKLMRSETDDGGTYTAYFVISTDLTNKQGLAYYKRILDLWLYFNKEDSGSADVYVKRDSEPDWQYVGTITLTGDEDIIIKHLAPDIRAKHFLFKIEASNHFEFLGALFEWPVEAMGMR